MCDEFDFNHYFIFESKYDGKSDNSNNSSNFHSNKFLPSIYFDEFRINRGMLKITKTPRNSDISIRLINSNNFGMIRPKRLREILLNDSYKGPMRSYDGEWPLWNGFLSQLLYPPEFRTEPLNGDYIRKLQDLAILTLKHCGDQFSIQWALNLADVFVKNDIPFPKGFLQLLLSHAVERSDINGIIEVLVYTVQESYRFKRVASSNSDIQISKLKDCTNYSWDLSSKLGAKVPDSSAGSDDASFLRDLNKTLIYKGISKSVATVETFPGRNSEGNVDGLSEVEWGQAINAIIQEMEKKQSFKEHILLEVIRLSKEYGEKLELQGLHAMLRYLSLCRPSSTMAPQILKELVDHSKKVSDAVTTRAIDDLARIMLSRLEAVAIANGNGLSVATDPKDIIADFKPHRNAKYPAHVDDLINELSNYDTPGSETSKVVFFYRMHSSTPEGKIRLFSLLSDLSTSISPRLQNSKAAGDGFLDTYTKLLIFSAFQVVDGETSESVRSTVFQSLHKHFSSYIL